MTPTQTTLYQACDDLFDRYPLAIDDDDLARAMVLMLPADPNPEFFILVRFNNASDYLMHAWASEDEPVSIQANGHGDMPAEFARAITEAVPLPRDGSMFGWLSDGTVTSVLVMYTRSDEHSAIPTFSTMPRTDAPESDWAAMKHPQMGSWFWDGYRTGQIVALGPVVADRRDSVFWVDTREAIGSSCVAVERDVAGPGGWTLPRGAYGWLVRGAVKEGVVPDLDALLADPGKVDLAPRFRECEA